MMILGLLGYAGSGKDTLCGLICELLPEARRYAFADALKREVSDGYEIPLDRLEANKADYRHLLQTWGCGRRDQDAEYWVKQVAAKIEAERPELAIITDVRFKNEADWILAQGGWLFRVVRPGCGPANDHISETEAESILAHEVCNRSDLGALRLRARALLHTISFHPTAV